MRRFGFGRPSDMPVPLSAKVSWKMFEAANSSFPLLTTGMYCEVLA